MRTTITVTDTADDGPGTLRAALASAADGDTIDFSLLSTPATIALTSDELSVSNSVTILGPGPNALAVAADKSVFPRIRIFRICSNTVVNLSGLTITNGSARFDSGGGIFNDHATLTVSNCTLSGNYATHFGGGIMNDEGLLRIVNSSVCGNFGGISGGGI